MKSNRRILSILCILMTLAMLSMSVLAGAADTMSVQLPDLSSYYKDKDIDDTFEDDKAVHIVLTGTDWLADNENGFSCEDQVLTITTKGTYVLSGTWNGQIRVQVPEEDKVHLILNGVTVESPEGPAILDSPPTSSLSPYRKVRKTHSSAGLRSLMMTTPSAVRFTQRTICPSMEPAFSMQSVRSHTAFSPRQT